MRHAIITDETVVQSDNLAAEVVLDLFGQDGPPPVTVAALLEFLEREETEGADRLPFASLTAHMEAALARMQAQGEPKA